MHPPHPCTPIIRCLSAEQRKGDGRFMVYSNLTLNQKRTGFYYTAGQTYESTPKI